ncbi:hypothetical protein N7650_16375 [Pseudomonas sp. GD04058]|uniref:hypothetical protein n=1 Tax=Pseudomonas sp. GD04058 TaxID=2975429 RepID=UPI00244BE056|nr:hypothetical protein [Pseudomonas sp. GD04058]MDG9884415.1 hypothetical protein [Pseudomonas sp. GD04058]
MNNLTDQLEFIASLEIATNVVRPLLQSPPDEPDAPGPSSDSAVVAGDSLLSFVAGLTRQAREDVLNSTLLMQLAANKRFDKARQREEWFGFYTEGLGKLGWTLSHTELLRFHPSQASFCMNDVIIEIIEGVVGGSAFSPIARRTLESLRKQPHALELFMNHSNAGHVGTFQILPCSQNAAGDVTMLMNCVQLIRNVSNNSFLFINFQNNEVQIFRSAQTAVLNVQAYEQVRGAVIEKLGRNASQFVANLSL